MDFPPYFALFGGNSNWQHGEGGGGADNFVDSIREGVGRSRGSFFFEIITNNLEWGIFADSRVGTFSQIF